MSYNECESFVKISNLYWLLLTYDVLYTQFSTQGSIVLKRGEKMLDNRKKKILQAGTFYNKISMVVKIHTIKVKQGD